MRTQAEIYRHLREYRDALTQEPHFALPEISGGQILMMMSPSPRHDLNALRIQQQLLAQLEGGLVAATLGDVEDENLGVLRRPDVIVVPEAAFDTSDSALDPAEILLAVEIVSPNNPENDYQGKLRDYPAMGIPHYVIIDPRDGTAHHYWKPVAKGGRAVYEAHVPYVFGDVIKVDEWTIDTGALRRYAPEDGE
ncbi:Uma2 family endonuclease [Streptacidiphilus neutrinimicus]|uniref:Uma2 family endonuclease n=1 Tax=Streptacidiphilus neutrinimicus TaxID=105420 RepID=UPI0005AB6E60|nr:Uma2 family endonuclease [Streptacidiphilus neutrinimicus]